MIAFTDFDQFAEFAHHVMRESRYHLSSNHRRFLDIVRATSDSRVMSLPKKTPLWRSQLGCEVLSNDEDFAPFRQLSLFDPQQPYSKQRMKPLRGRAKEGRLNPKGIPYFYCSNNRTIALAEVRPWIGAFVTIAEVHLTKAVRLVDCSNPVAWAHPQTIPTDPEEITAVVWYSINAAFSRPVSHLDDVAEYAPTQVLAEAFRQNGFDGVAYSSAFSDEGMNIALFNPSFARIGRCVVEEVSNIQFSFRRANTLPRRRRANKARGTTSKP